MDLVPFDIIKLLINVCGLTFKEKLCFMSCSKYLNRFVEIFVSDNVCPVTYTPNLLNFKYYNKLSNLQFKGDLSTDIAIAEFNIIVWPCNMTHLIIQTYAHYRLSKIIIPKSVTNLTINYQYCGHHYCSVIRSMCEGRRELLCIDLTSSIYVFGPICKELFLKSFYIHSIQNIVEIDIVLNLNGYDNLEKLVLDDVDISDNISNRDHILIKYKNDIMQNKLVCLGVCHN